MTKSELENWAKIKAALEQSGNTESFYYRRACEILKGKPDPLR